jgi:two-component system OmpR family sensor kinase
METSQERRNFLRRLDHELKNPLTAMQAGLTNLTSQPLQEYQQEEAEAIQNQLLRVSRLVTDLRKLSALETAPLEQSTVDLGELLEEVVEVIENKDDAKGRAISLILPQAPWPLPEINGDPDLLLLALHNLLDNAIKFTAPGDTIEIRAFEDGSDVVIEIADTGPGIPSEEISKVWEELYRGQQARGVPGSGLGLSLVRAIIEKHGGRVGLRSKEQKGSVFNVHLPVR